MGIGMQKSGGGKPGLIAGMVLLTCLWALAAVIPVSAGSTVVTALTAVRQSPQREDRQRVKRQRLTRRAAQKKRRKLRVRYRNAQKRRLRAKRRWNRRYSRKRLRRKRSRRTSKRRQDESDKWMQYIGINSELPHDLEQALSNTGTVSNGRQDAGKPAVADKPGKTGKQASAQGRQSAPGADNGKKQNTAARKKVPAGGVNGDSELFYSDYENTGSLQLPDFTKTYGFDFQPDIGLYKKPKKQAPLTRKQKLKAFKRRLDKKFSKTTKTGGRYGVQRYTKYTGSSRVGIGYKLKKDGKKTSITFHQRGLGIDREDSSKHKKYFIGVDTRSPNIKANQKESTYMYFGIKLQW